MLGNIVRKIFGSKNDREIKRMGKIVQKINAFEETISSLDDEHLRAKTAEFKRRIEQGETLNDLLPEAFAVVREAAKRTLGLRHFDVQMIGGITLHEGRIAEMRTGEGKTLVATLPVYLNALTGKGAYVVTVNDYLAARDANWMRPVYEFLGLTVGIVLSGQDGDVKRAAYACDITYGTNNEFGFDYLRDNMSFSIEDRFQRGLNFAIVDEVDSILIDEARTPLIISGPAQDSSDLYKKINKLIPRLKQAAEPEVENTEPDGHFTVDEKSRQIELTEQGHLYVEQLLTEAKLLDEGESLYSATNLTLLQHVFSGLRAHKLFHRDVEYIVQNGQVVLIDEHTGRTMPGRRLSEGLHQALEAKEGVDIQAESQTLASTTFQNYFRLYNKLAGMTGTADTEAFEFHHIYGLDVVVIPTNVPQLRKDLNDLVYLSKDEKYDAIVQDVNATIAKGAPVLVGTASIETSEELSRRFNKEKIEHKVLNAKFHQQEAAIIAQAGRPGVVTIATNMAGRGTDIVLGGNVEVEIAALDNPSAQEIQKLRDDWKKRHQAVLDAGGLHIIATERHESRRIDNQLRGRAGRQGDPGVSRFYLSMEDNLMRIFASDRVRNFMQALGMEKGEAIEHRMVSNSIEKAQRKVEGRNFDIRKQLLEYDDVANDQRQIVYRQRADLLESDDIHETIEAIRSDVINDVISEYIPPQSLEEQWDVAGLEQRLANEFSARLSIRQWLDADDNLHEEPLREKIVAALADAYNLKVAQVGPEIRRLERNIMLQILDNLWKEHLATMDHLRQGIHLRAYAQKNPKQEYKREAFELFQSMLHNLKYEVVRFLSNVQIKRQDEIEELERQRREADARQEMVFKHADASGLDEGEIEKEVSANTEPFVREGKKVGRNEPCPCGSGKKFKQCHGALS
jgi:preprotein translocase subunit SecA